MAHFDRERIPERVVHAKGGGAFGYFEVTHDVSQYTAAKVFSSIGKRTPMGVRFSTVAGEMGSSDTVRDPRGFALKFYTEDGIWDLVGRTLAFFLLRKRFIHVLFFSPQETTPPSSSFATPSCFPRLFTPKSATLKLISGTLTPSGTSVLSVLKPPINS